MILVDDPYAKGERYLRDSEFWNDYQLEKALGPDIRARSQAFRHGCVNQLMACIGDLRMWAVQFRALGKDELAEELDGFADDWEIEAQEYCGPSSPRG